MEKECRHRLH